MVKSKRFNESVGRIMFRLLVFTLNSIVIPLAIKTIKNKIIENQRLWCSNCNKRLDKINKYEYYCKNCKIIRDYRN
ncbi:MAG: hypothetical protein ACTHKK_07390 [Candidatus Nitrosocosmicus sp.]